MTSYGFERWLASVRAVGIDVRDPLAECWHETGSRVLMYCMAKTDCCTSFGEWRPFAIVLKWIVWLVEADRYIAGPDGRSTTSVWTRKQGSVEER